MLDGFSFRVERNDWRHRRERLFVHAQAPFRDIRQNGCFEEISAALQALSSAQQPRAAPDEAAGWYLTASGTAIDAGTIWSGPAVPAGAGTSAGTSAEGVSVANDEAARQRLLAAGATELNPVGLGEVFYEAKFRSPEGLIIDVGHWAGASPVAVEEPALAGE